MIDAWIAIIIRVERDLLILRTDTGLMIRLLQPPVSLLKLIRRGYRVGDVAQS